MDWLAPTSAGLTTGSEWVILSVLAALAVLVVSSSFTHVPYPIWLLLGGLAIGFIPGVPSVQLDPELVFLIALPPLLYSAAFFSSLRDLRSNTRPISMLAVGLVLVTTVVVAAVAHSLIDELSWSTAFVLGAVVSPTDPLAVTTIARRLGLPRNVLTVVEGEALVNDAVALILYRVAVVAVVSGSFSLAEAGLDFVVSAVGGIAVGLVVGWIVTQLRSRLDDAPTEITISLMTAYFAYLPAVALDLSGVLAAVTVGIYLGWNAPRLVTSPQTRMQTYAVWEILVFVLNVLLFVLLGLQFQDVLDSLSGYSTTTLIGYAALVSAVVIVVRLLYVFPFVYLPEYLFRRRRERDPDPSWQLPLLVAWSGMRGAVSLAAALAIPLQTDAGAAFPGRNLTIFLTFCVILATLVLQGLTMPKLITAFDIEDDGADEREEARARIAAAEAALDRMDELFDEDWVREDTAERMRGLYDWRRRRFAARIDGGDDDGDDYEERSADFQRLRRELLAAERQALVELRNRGVINDEVMRRVQQDLDLEDSRLES
jgi:monovalent cation/hydrogen antiporter